MSTGCWVISGPSDVVIRANRMSSFAICTPLLSPKLLFLPDDPPQHDHVNSDLTFANVTKFVQEIRAMNHSSLNNRIVEVSRAPLFHTYGVDSRRGLYDEAPRHVDPELPLQFTRKHRLHLWREPRFENMVHLKDYQIYKMGKTIINYYENMWRV